MGEWAFLHTLFIKRTMRKISVALHLEYMAVRARNLITSLTLSADKPGSFIFDGITCDLTTMKQKTMESDGLLV